jgi:hypothetical protein
VGASTKRRLTTRSLQQALRGKNVFPAIDGRSTEIRRLRRLVEHHLADIPQPSHAERTLIGRAGVLSVLLERMEVKFAKQQWRAAPDEVDSYGRCVSHLRRVLETLGLQRRSRDVTGLTLGDLLREDHRRQLEEADATAE